MTTNLERSSRTKQKLYKETLKQDSTCEDKEKYLTYRNQYNRMKRAIMRTYYSEKCEQYKSNTKKLLELMNGVINKNKHNGILISYIMVDGVKKSTTERP